MSSLLLFNNFTFMNVTASILLLSAEDKEMKDSQSNKVVKYTSYSCVIGKVLHNSTTVKISAEKLAPFIFKPNIFGEFVLKPSKANADLVKLGLVDILDKDGVSLLVEA